MYAEVIIPIPIPKTYTYHVPASMESMVIPGVRVEVSFGKKKRYAGVVKSITDAAPKGFEPKPIIQILDPEPIVYEEQLKLWTWIAHYYMCSEGEVMAAALPTHLKLSSETILIWNDEFGEDFTDLDDKEYLVAEGLLLKKELKLDEVQEILDITHVYPVVKSLLEKRVCFAWESLKEKYTVKKENFIRLHPNYQNEEALANLLNQWTTKAPKQLELLLAYIHLLKKDGVVKQADLLKKSGASSAQLKGLIDKAILLVTKENVDRIHLKEKEVLIDFELTPKQLNALSAVKKHLNEKNICLLHGVTSSGKTLLYIQLIEEQIKKGKQVLYMLPEIALTAQIIRRLEKHFGGYIAIYHSKFNPNERVELWNRVKKGEIRIVLGARSSLFLPFSNLSLIIVDEEQDVSFKQQEPSPRYNARDAALYYAKQCNAQVVLGSATPSIESYAQAIQGKYGLVELFERYGGVEMPSIELADLRALEGNKVVRKIISETLKQAIEDTLNQQKQVILFQNRRGYTPYKICGTCGNIPHCDHCDVTLTYHKLQHKLQCHYCGTSYPVFNTCVACGSNNWIEKNFGTEKVEEHLQEMFPNHTVARMDVDTVKGKAAHEDLIRNFEQRRMDILVGTQMVVKGLDFENVMLVGILDADGLLSFTDFRVNERAFQLMEQVSGRAGRRQEKGRVIIQGTQLAHPVIEWVVAHDYSSMFEKEYASRKLFHYPPFTRLVQIFFKHTDKTKALNAASFIANRLSSTFGDYLIGPAEPVINRVRNKYIYEILLKLPRSSEQNSQARMMIQQSVLMLQSEASLKSVHVQINVDPM